jgi:membrane-associated phospholipid phosphatase
MSAGREVTGESTFAAARRRCLDNVGLAFKLLLKPAKIHPRRPWPIEPRRLAMAAGAGVLIFLFCMFVIDGPIGRAVLHAPRWLIWPFGQITQFGLSGWFLWPLGILFLALASLPSAPTRISQAVMAAIMVRIGFLFTAIAIPGLFVTTVKRMIGRARPMVTGHIDPFAFAPFIWRAAYASLPSGHATTAFSVLAAFGSLWPRGRAVLLLYASLIALSRIMVLAHFPSDVLAGAVVGTVGTLMVRRYFALRRLGFSVGPGDAIVAYHWPSFRRIKAVARELLAP